MPKSLEPEICYGRGTLHGTKVMDREMGEQPGGPNKS